MRWFGLFVLLLLAACERAPEGRIHTEQALAFGTLVDISIYDSDEARAQRASAAAMHDFEHMHAIWHPWQAGSLGRVNSLLPYGGKFVIAPHIGELIEKARPLAQSSGGRFNPAIGGLVKLWGLHESPREPGPPPAAEDIAKLVAAHPSLADLSVDGVQLDNANPAVLLDFGGFAKGYAVDRVIEHLRELGVENAIVNAGGDLRAMGSKGGKAWRVGVRHPRGSSVLAALEIQGDEAVFTSGDYERFFEWEGRRYHHILDPRTGYPATGLTSVTVIHAEAAVADAAATALFVAGPREWPQVAAAMGLQQVMVVTGEGVVEVTPAMAARLKFEAEPAKLVTRALP